MRCPDTSTWRAWLDDEVAVPDAEHHLSTCADCIRDVDRLRGAATYVAGAVALLDPPVVAAPPQARPEATQRSVRGRQWLTSAAAALVAVAVVATPTGRAVAGDFLSLFRSDTVALVAVDEPSLENTAEALGQLGEAHDVSAPEPVEVGSIDEAMQRTGIAVTVPDPATLPAGAGPQPEIRVTDAQQLRFTFREAATRRYLAQFDEVDRPLPAGYDGATLVVDIPAGVLQAYRAPDGTPAVLVGHAGTVTAAVDGDIELETLRAFLLELPGLPESVVSQLSAIDDWRTTLPVPIPVDRVGGQETTVNGAEAILIEQQGFGSGLLWQRDGVVTGVAGRLDEAALRAVVDSLRAP